MKKGLLILAASLMTLAPVSAPAGVVTIAARSISLQADAEIEVQAGAALTLSGATIGINDP